MGLEPATSGVTGRRSSQNPDARTCSRPYQARVGCKSVGLASPGAPARWRGVGVRALAPPTEARSPGAQGPYRRLRSIPERRARRRSKRGAARSGRAR
jgi:hypothetical protein